MSVHQHPDYHDGFFDALDFTPIFDDCTPEYRAGWEAMWRAREIFKNAGLTEEGRSFVASASIQKPDSQP